MLGALSGGGAARRIRTHAYTFALAAMIGVSSTAALLGVYWLAESKLGRVAAVLVATAVSVIVLFLAMLAAEELTRALVKRGLV